MCICVYVLYVWRGWGTLGKEGRCEFRRKTVESKAAAAVMLVVAHEGCVEKPMRNLNCKLQSSYCMVVVSGHRSCSIRVACSIATTTAAEQLTQVP